ncbi:Alpha/Beta hydrolase protein [Chytridium lagenaria]|nr:Alpha/Beta hydrolase protein [Chytridium lagenaria]
MSTSKEEWIKASDGVDIFTKTWEPQGKPVVATLVAVHGLGEHISRYDEMFSHLARSGIRVHGFDQRGFGRTGRRSGILGHNDKFERTLLDVKEAELRVLSPSLPHFIFGHSMGGCIVLNYSIRYPENLKGVIASAPLVESGKKTKVSTVEYYAVRGLSMFLGTFAINNPVDPKALAKDAEVAKVYTSDPNVHPFITLQTAVDIVMNGEALLSEGYKKFPKHAALIMTHGTEDVLTCPIASRKFYDKVEISDKEYREFDGAYHELHNDFGKEDMYKLYTDFILKRLK